MLALQQSRMEGGQASGRGCIEVEAGEGRSIVTRMESSYPLKLMHPCKINILNMRPAESTGVAGGAVGLNPTLRQAAGAAPPSAPHPSQPSGETEEGAGAAGRAAVIYVVTYGGGAVGGDAIHLECSLHRNTAAVLTTQSSTKVFKCAPSPSPPSQQMLSVSVAQGAFLAVLPDPVTCFSQARYLQQQTFCVARGGNLVLVDWLTCGRRALGETWALASYQSSNRLFWGGSLVALEQLHLSSDNLVGLPLAQQLQHVHALGFLLLIGPQTHALQEKLRGAVDEMMGQQLQRSRGRTPPHPAPESSAKSVVQQDPWVSYSPLDVPDPAARALLVRFSAQSTESVYRFLRKHLAALSPVLGWPPYSNLGS